jgi:acyl-CoA thioesterase-1
MDFRKLVALAVFTVACPASAATLFVVGEVPASGPDATIVGELQQLGQTVTVVKDIQSAATDAAGMDLVVISDSVAAGNVGNKFNQVAVPLIVYEASLYDNLGLTGTAAGTDFARRQNQTQLRIVGTSPLTAGLSGLVTVANSVSSFSWGKPAASAVVAATLKGDSTRATIFGYNAGAMLASGTSAPARRVAFYPNTGAINAWNANGQKLFGAAVQWALAGPAPGATRILPLGDSITRGKNGHWTYRRDLEASLKGSGCPFDFVGRRYGPDTGPGEPLQDRDNEGHPGFRTDEILAKLALWLPGNVPDWALVHIGTNDVLQGVAAATARSNIAGIIDTLRNANPRVGILLAQIIPNYPANEAAVNALNDAIVSLGAQKDMPGVSPVIVVDMYSGYDALVNNYDTVHPNDSGEGIMARRWFQALHTEISATCAQ